METFFSCSTTFFSVFFSSVCLSFFAVSYLVLSLLLSFLSGKNDQDRYADPQEILATVVVSRGVEALKACLSFVGCFVFVSSVYFSVPVSPVS